MNKLIGLVLALVASGMVACGGGGSAPPVPIVTNTSQGTSGNVLTTATAAPSVSPTVAATTAPVVVVASPIFYTPIQTGPSGSQQTPVPCPSSGLLITNDPLTNQWTVQDCNLPPNAQIVASSQSPSITLTRLPVPGFVYQLGGHGTTTIGFALFGATTAYLYAVTI